MVLDDGILLQLDARRFRRVLAPKADGAWILHSRTLGRPLDFFVLFSSVSSITGSHGQGNYVAANAFLDALAHYRRALGLPAVAINWGHLAKVGYVSRHEKLGESLTSRGVEGIPPAQAMEALGLILRRKPIQIGVMRMDWQKLSRSMRGPLARRLSLLITETFAEQAGTEKGKPIREVLHQAKPEERKQIAEGYIREQVARVLGTSAGKLDVEQPLNELGLDSLMAIELKNRIEADLVLSLPTGRLVQGPSIGKLSTEVLLELGKDGAAGMGEAKAERDGGVEMARAVPRLVSLRAEGVLPPLFCIHPGSGATDIYKPLAGLLSSQMPVYGIQSDVLNGSHSIEGMAKDYAHVICARQPEGPYYLLGFSLGGFIAMATAKFLEQQGEDVAFIGLVDCDVAWTNPSTFVLRDLISETYRLIQKGSSFLEPLGVEQLTAEAGKLSAELLSISEGERIEALIGWLRDRNYVRKDLSYAALRDYLVAFERHVSLAANFEPPRVHAPLFVWYADEGLSGSEDGNRAWADFTAGPVMEKSIRGSHYTIMHLPSVAVPAEEIGKSLGAVRAS
jgi:thioesterase domain-containing protein/acyl carrier protein